MFRGKRTGFTLVELLVVIVIIAILVALLLPAIQKAREAARRNTCSNNLKQLAIGVINYENGNKALPPAVTFRGWGPTVTTIKTETSEDYDKNWVIYILPFIEQKTLYDLFDFTQPLNPGTLIDSSTSRPVRNVLARNTELSTMLCPADTGADEHFFKNGMTLPAGYTTSQVGWARGNYGANGGSNSMEEGAGPTPDGTSRSTVHCGRAAGNGLPLEYASQARGITNKFTRGVFGVCMETKLVDITDGLSKTMLLSEIRIGVNQKDRRGTWAMSCPGASSVFWCGRYGDANGPNPVGGRVDDIIDCYELCKLAGNNDTTAGFRYLSSVGMTCWNKDAPDQGQKQGAARSRHPGGVLTVACDASVHWASNESANPAIDGLVSSVLEQEAYPWDFYIVSQDGGQLNVGLKDAYNRDLSAYQFSYDDLATGKGK